MSQKKTKYIYYDEGNNLVIIDYWVKICEEINIMKLLGSHENVIQLFEVINSDQHPYIYLITTYCDLGQIMLVERDEDRFYYKQNNELLKFFGIKYPLNYSVKSKIYQCPNNLN